MKGEVTIIAGGSDPIPDTSSLGVFTDGSIVGGAIVITIQEIPDASLAALAGTWIRFTNLIGDIQDVYIESVDEFSVSEDKLYAESTTALIDFSLGGIWISIIPQFPTRLDLYEDESISQNYQFTDISTFAARGSFTREFRLPYTDRNQEVFGMIPQVNYTEDGEIFDRKIPAEIRVDNLPIIYGYLRVIRVIKQRNREYDIEVSFYGSAPDLFNQIGTKKLGDLTDLDNKNHVVDLQYIDEQPDPDILYTLIDRGTNSNLTQDDVENTEITNPLKYSPSVRWGYIFRQILKDAGFTYDASELLSILDAIWMPWLNAVPYQIDPSTLGFKAVIRESGSYLGGGNLWSLDTPKDFTGIYPLSATNILPWREVYDSNGDYKEQGTSPDLKYAYYLTPYEAIYEFRLWARFDYASPAGINWSNYATLGLLCNFPSTGNSWYCLQGNGNLLALPVGSNGVFYMNGSAFAGDPYDQVIQLPLPAGTRVYYCLKFDITIGIFAAGDIYLYEGNDSDQQGTGWQLTNITNVVNPVGFEFSLKANAPDANQIDFMKDVLNMFNVAVIPDKLIPKKIKFIPMMSYLGSDSQDDWSNKLAIDKDIIIKNTSDYVKQTLSFTYSAGEDSASKLFKDIAGRIYGNYDASGYTSNAAETPFAFAQGDMKIQLTTQSSPCSNYPLTDKTLPRFINDSNVYIPPKMRALYHAATYTRTDGSTYRVLNHYSNVLPDFNDYDLNWAPETPLHSYTSNPYNNLFNTYWRGYLNEIYSKRGRVMEAFFALDLTDILSFSFAKYYWIHDSYWRVLSISDYKYGKDELTKVLLIKVLSVEAECNLKPVSTGFDGIVKWEDLDGNITMGTELCCRRYRFQWDERSQLCSSRGGFGSAGVKPGSSDIRDIIGKNDQKNRPQITSNDALIKADGIISSDTKRSIISGSDLKVADGNAYSMIIGAAHQIDKDNMGSAISGRNAYVKNIGSHFGGGARAGVGKLGAMQQGDILLSNTNQFNNAGDMIILSLGGDTLRSIELPEDSAWEYLLHITGYDLSTGSWIYAIYSGMLMNKGGALSYSNPILISSDDFTTGLLFYPVWGTTNSPFFRLDIQLNNPGAPFLFPITLNIVAHLDYTQIR